VKAPAKKGAAKGAKKTTAQPKKTSKQPPKAAQPAAVKKPVKQSLWDRIFKRSK
jgi:hypothetical protein